MEEKKNAYFLGLDVGTNSIGYAVTDLNYTPLFYRRKRMLGVSLFQGADLKSDRRSFRSARRRLRRKQQRIQLIQEFFATEIANKDDRFFIRIKESALWPEDKSSAKDISLLFNDSLYTDKEYYTKYPTIHHLIMDLIEDSDPKDIRLVYLAIAYLTKNRGHFLSSMDEDSINIVEDFNDTYEKFISYIKENGNLDLNINREHFRKVLKKETGINNKKSLFTEVFDLKELKKQIADEVNEVAYNPISIIALLSGGSVQLKTLFMQKSEEYAELQSISLEKSLEDLELALHEIGDDSDLILMLKSLYDWKELVNILGDEGSEYISKSKVAMYEQHRKDLKTLKMFVLDCSTKDTYNKIFKANPSEPNYAAYVYNHNDRKIIKRKATEEDFYKFLKKELDSISPTKAYETFYNDMLDRIELRTFLPKQKTKSNNVIPYQLHLHQVKSILSNAEKYLPFLMEKDQEGLAVSDKIIATFKFRVPYYVGVLNTNSSFSWVVRGPEKIYPWNIDQVVDYDQSEEAFIDQMIGRCTYLPLYSVVPKKSLLYQKYEVLNEINNLKINGIPIDVELKQELYNNLFCKRNKRISVTRKDISNYLTANKGKGDYILSGIDEKINSSLSSYHDFKRLLQKKVLNEQQVEMIIKRISSTTDQNRLDKWLKTNFPQVNEDDRKYLTRLKYKDYGRLSKQFLSGIEGTDKNTGQVFTILEALWETNDNLMQLLSDKYTFKEIITAQINEILESNEKTLDEKMDEMYISNPVRRQIRKTTDIVNELVKIQGEPPQKIFVEMARGGTLQQRNKRTKSRKVALQELMKNAEVDVRYLAEELETCSENQLQSKKLFLYFTQLGRCVYTGKPINLQSIIENRGEFDIDHIWPRSKIADDSIDNTVLSDSTYNENVKGNSYPILPSTRKAMYYEWKKLKDSGFITETKFSRLTRATPFTEEEMWNFINRQLVETRQSTKALTVLLQEKFPDTEIVFVKAGLVSDFRNEFSLPKSRVINDLHHAKDAYLNIVVGNVYHERFTRSWFLKNSSSYNLKISALFKRELMKGDYLVWAGDKELARIKNETNNNNIQVVANPFTRKGGFYDQMPLKAGVNSIAYNLKQDMPAEKYGGYGKPTASYFVLVSFMVNEKKEVMFIPVDLIASQQFESNEEYRSKYLYEAIQDYYSKKINLTEIEILLNGQPIKIDSVIELDGYRMCIKGKTGGVSLSLGPSTDAYYNINEEAYIRRLDAITNKIAKNDKILISEKYDKINANDNIELYDLLLSKISSHPFNKRPNSGINLLVEGRDVFVSKADDLHGQAKVLLEIISIMTRGAASVDLRFLSKTKSACNPVINLKLSNLLKKYNYVRIINQSPTGLYENKSENLLSLL